MIEPTTLKGFRDFLPKDARKRQYVINTLKSVFESYGFEPLETPALEYEEILTGKYGDEGDRLMYRFEDLGKRKVAMRYDQTVPLARVIAQYQNEITFPFKRYQIQPVWRAENTQAGRFREFLHVDADIVGSNNLLSDTEIIALAVKSMEKLGFKNFKVLLNDRNNFSLTISKKLNDKDFLNIIRAIDKLKKAGEKAVLEEITKIGLTEKDAQDLLNEIKTREQSEIVKKIYTDLKNFGVSKDKIEYYPTLARGMDYYTSMIFEIEVENYKSGSICGGGRYDNLIGMFANKQIPAVGYAFGFDRLMEAMELNKLFPNDLQTTMVLVTIFSPEQKLQSIALSSHLRVNNINTEIYLDENVKMEKQLKYADKKGIPYVIIIGPQEAAKNIVQLKNMKTREQKEIPIEQLISELKL
jgi:histidyl-tRNA synthetase